MRVVVSTPPSPVVTWEEADAHLRLAGDDDEREYVESLIAAATGHIDGPNGWLGRSIGLQELEARFDLTETGRLPLRLPYGPVVDLLSVAYLDSNGIEQTADLDDFHLFGDEVEPKASVFPWDGGSLQREAGRIRYQAGYGVVPFPIKSAILLMVGDMHRFRGTASDMNVSPSAIPMSVTVNSLLAPFRVFS